MNPKFFLPAAALALFCFLPAVAGAQEPAVGDPAAEVEPGFETQHEQPEVSLEPPEESQVPEVQSKAEAPAPPTTQKKICKCRFGVEVPYTERRTTFGGIFDLQAGMFSPTAYQPAFRQQTYSSLYPNSPSVGIGFGLKWNFFLGSLTAHLTGSLLSVQNSAGDSKLTVIPVTGGMMYALDNLFMEPYVVPYVEAGAYMDFYNEATQGLTVQGNSPMAPFYSAGLMFQLDGLDAETHDTAYDEYGLENTFLFVEGRSFLSADNSLPDFSTPLQLNAGLRIEF